MEEYLKILLEQIRCRKAWPAVEEEFRCHIEEQAAANVLQGMDKEEALRCAVRDMGDPVETGVDLDRVHRPQTAWDVVGVMLVIALASIFIHVVIGLGAEEINYQPQGTYIGRAVCYIVAGFAAMLIVYRLDYSFLARRGKLCAVAFLALMTLGAVVYGMKMHGGMLFLDMGVLSFSIVYVMFLYVPLYGAVLYQYRGSGFGGLAKSFLFLVYPVWLAVKIPCMSLGLLLLFLLSVLLSAAVAKGWFHVPKKSVLAGYWFILAAGMPLFYIFVKFNSASAGLPAYQAARLEAFFNSSFQDNSYVTKMLAELLQGSRFLGGSGQAVAGVLPNYYSEYILAFLYSYYGIAAPCAACLLIAAVAVRALRIALGQRNQLGMMIGLGSGLVMLTNTVMNILENTGLFPPTMTFLPFFSYTGSGIFVSYILAGIVLSVYRYKNILPVSGAKAGAARKESA